jgi:hypothetical protein
MSVSPRRAISRNQFELASTSIASEAVCMARRYTHSTRVHVLQRLRGSFPSEPTAEPSSGQQTWGYLSA